MEKKEEEGGDSQVAQVALPGAEELEIAEALHMMQHPPLRCHGSKSSAQTL